MKNLLLPLLFLSILFNIALLYFFVFKGSTETIEGGRQEIQMNKAQRNYALLEMRSFLESIRLIQKGIIEKNYTLVEKGGKLSGSMVEHDAPQGMMSVLPMEFKKLGFDTHDRFKKIEIMAKNQASFDDLALEMNTMMNNCVTCHKVYSINPCAK